MENLIPEKILRHSPKFTRSQNALSHYILEHAAKIPFISSAFLARKVQVCNATVYRFCMLLGYAGFTDFQ